VALRRLFRPLIDQGIRLKGPPGEPEVVPVDDGLQPFSFQRPLRGFAQDVPDTTRLVVDKVVALGPKGELLASKISVEHSGGANLARLSHQQVDENGQHSRFEKDHQIPVAHPVVDRTPWAWDSS